MLQIIDLETKELFTQISSTESASVNGGGAVFGALTTIAALGGGAWTFSQGFVQAAIFANSFNPLLP